LRRLCSLRLELAKFTLQHHHAIFQVAQPLFHGGLVIGLGRGRRGTLWLLG
jgi:hypothetical protein